MRGSERPPQIYFIGPCDRRVVKIGVSINPLSRLNDLMCWSPEPLDLWAAAPGGYNLERKLHFLFRDLHSHKEWFVAAPVLLALVEEVRRENVIPARCQMINLPKNWWLPGVKPRGGWNRMSPDERRARMRRANEAHSRFARLRRQKKAGPA